MSAHPSDAAVDPAARAAERESVTAGAVSVGALGSVLGLAVASTVAAPVIGLVAGGAIGAGLGHLINRWRGPGIRQHENWPSR